MELNAERSPDIMKKICDEEIFSGKISESNPLINIEFEKYKNELSLLVDKKTYVLDTFLQECKELYTENVKLTQEMCKEYNEIENGTLMEMEKSIEDYTMFVRELEYVVFSGSVVEEIVYFVNLIKKVDKTNELTMVVPQAESILSLYDFLDSASAELKSLDLISYTKQHYKLILSTLLETLNDQWADLVKWNSETESQIDRVTLEIYIQNTPKDIDMINALIKCKQLDEKMTDLSVFILNFVFVPIMKTKCEINIEADNHILKVKFKKKNSKPTYDEVIANLEIVFNYLKTNIAIKIDQQCTLMNMIGNNICTDFKEELIQNCLIDTVPNNVVELKFYVKITSDIEKFQHFLLDMNFFPDGKMYILEYVENIDALFASKSSQYFLDTARSIMFKDLSITMSIGVEAIPEEKSQFGKDATCNVSEEALTMFDQFLPNSLFYFPRCMISKSAQELLDILFEIMEQAVQCSEVVCKELYLTTRLILDMYEVVVPYHHQKFIESIPQYVALFHNNCIFLAHNLQLLGDKWLIYLEGNKYHWPICYIDLVPRLRYLGCKHLANHMYQQRIQILDHIGSSDLNNIGVKDVLDENANAAVRKCLIQLQLLKNVWIGVFPANVFVRLMSTLVSKFLDELIHRVCTVEDISMEIATQLTEIFSMVVKKTSQLFQSPSEIETHVKSWRKFQELIFVLGGSLKDIENHWKEGKGPLAIHFDTRELRALIKALFQNTQFRANILSKIK